MVRLSDVNTTDIADAVRLGCNTMCHVFNADDNGIPFFSVVARPDAEISMSLEAHIPGRHLNGLLNAMDAVGAEVDEECIEKHTRAAFFSYGGAVPLPLGRSEGSNEPDLLGPHDIREGFHALYALVKYRDSRQARELAEKSIALILDYWDPVGDIDYDRLQRDFGLKLRRGSSFINEAARSIGPLVKYYRATGYGPALELALMLKERAVSGFFRADGSYDDDLFGTHCHSTTCVLSSLAQLADLTHDSVLMGRVKAFYDNGLKQISDELGWGIETSRREPNNGRGEANNTGDILETALVLGRWGYPEGYHDAERILRGHLLPSQLRDVSWIEEPPNPQGLDGRKDVARRLKGSFGFPAPYGHEPLNIDEVKFNTDVVGGSVGSLCEAFREVATSGQDGLRVNLLFDHETADVRVQSPYKHGSLTVTVKRPTPLFVRVPPWVNEADLRVKGSAGPHRMSNGYALIAQPPVNRPITFDFPLPSTDLTLTHPPTDEKLDGGIRVKLRGDEVVAMDNFGADLTFFAPL